MFKWSTLGGVGTGLFFMIQYLAFSFGFWYGTQCIAGNSHCPVSVTGSVYTPGDATIVFFAMFVGSFNFMSLTPNVLAIMEGMKAATRLYKVIDSPSVIEDMTKSKGKKRGGNIKGEIIF